MAKNNQAITSARAASGLTLEDARKILGYSYQPYKNRELDPSSFTAGELRMLYTEFNIDGKRIFARWLSSFFGLRCDEIGRAHV